MNKRRNFLATASSFAFAALIQLSGSSWAEGFDTSGVKSDPALAARLPTKIKDAGVLTIGSDTAYAPWEYLSEKDGQTPEGIDVDIAKAIGATLGVKIDFQTSAFDAILPSLGSKYDLGVSAFSITNERMNAVNFVSYSASGSLWVVKTGNPAGFDASNLCGKTIAVQSGTIFETTLQQDDKTCTASGKEAIKFLPFATQSEALTRVAAGGADATTSGGSTQGYAAKQSGGVLETLAAIGPLAKTELNGIAVAKSDMELTQLIADTINKLIADGTYASIYKAWGDEGELVSKAEVNPKVSE